MIIHRPLGTAGKALRQNKLRALLTILGIVIGIAAVIAMVEIGNGSANAIKQTITSMGANTIMIQPGTAASGGVSFGAGTTMTLTVEDAQGILKEVPQIAHAAPVVRTRSQVVNGNRNWVPQSIYGTTPEFLQVRDWRNFSEGEMFSERDVRNGNKVCVIGETIKR
jgi:ABC-type antimicrobial peptide transport system permease subunit